MWDGLSGQLGALIGRSIQSYKTTPKQTESHNSLDFRRSIEDWNPVTARRLTRFPSAHP